MIKVCVLSTVHTLYDVRIFYKECATLKSAGYDVFYIITHDKDECIDGINIIHLPRPKSRFVRIFFNTLCALIKAIKLKANIYHFHDPELIPAGIILKLLGRKVIYDVHENVPKDILDKSWIKPGALRILVSFFVSLIELIGNYLFDLIVVTDPVTEKRFKPSKTVFLDNFPIIDMIDQSKRQILHKTKPVVIYIGVLDKHRGIREIIQAMEILNDKVELWLAGRWSSEKFEQECRDMKGWEHTKYFGNLKPVDAYGYLKDVDIGIVACYPIQNYLNSLPTKVFEYMTCSLPMIISNFPLWQNLFKDCALFINPADPCDIAEKIGILLNDESKMKLLGKRGRILIEKKYSWEAESKKLIDCYNNLVK